MRLFSLGGRLGAAADFIPEGARVADVGTDHCRLPVWLIMTGRVARVIATDIRELPLERGRENCRRWGVEDRVELRLGNGLECVAPEECTHVVICGMGGENILSILDAADWTGDGNHELILQAETSAAELRRWLYEKDFTIAQEKAVVDSGRVYTVMRVIAGREETSPENEYASAALLRQHDRAAGLYFERVARSVQRQLLGIDRDDPEFEKKLKILEFFKGKVEEYGKGE